MRCLLNSRVLLLLAAAIACLVGAIWWLSPFASESPVPTTDRAEARRGPAWDDTPEEHAARRRLSIVDSATGEPVVGAAVRWGEMSLAWSDTNGELSWPETAPTRVNVGGRGYLPRRVVVGSQTRTIALQRGGHTISGEVRDLYGGVVPGAVVSAGTLAIARANDEGRYAVTVPAGHWRIEARSDDYFPSRSIVQVTEDATMNFDLLPGASIEGVVQDEHGIPMPDALVSYGVLVPRESGYTFTPASAEQSTRADSTGRFRLAPLRPASYQLLARTESASTPAPVSVRVGLLEARDGITLVVKPGHALTGRVFDDADALVAGARVVARHRAGSEVEALSDEEGGFRLQGLHDGAWSVHAAAGRGDVGAGVTVLVGADPEPVDLRLTRGGRIRGHVRDGAGTHVTLGLPAGPMAVADFSRAKAMRDLDVVVAEDGSFLFGSVPPGAWVVRARADDGHVGSVSVELEPAGEAEVELELEAPGACSGTLDNRGGDRTGVRVGLRQGDRRLAATGLDARGAFEFTRVPAGRWSLEVLHHGASIPIVEGPKEVELESDQHAEVSLVVDSESQVLRGRVVDIEGAPVADAHVEVRPTKGGETRQAVTDAEGRFELASASAATYRVDVTGPDDLGRAGVKGLAPDADLEVVLREPASVRGRVLADGRPVQRFQLRPTGLSVLGPYVSDDDGRFILEDVRPGDFTVTALASQGVASHTMRLEDGDVAEVTLELLPWAVARGRVVDSEGGPVAKARVEVSSEAGRAEGSDRAVSTDAEGRFSLEGLGPGPTVVIVTKGDATLRTEPLSAEPGAELELGDLEL